MAHPVLRGAEPEWFREGRYYGDTRATYTPPGELGWDASESRTVAHRHCSVRDEPELRAPRALAPRAPQLRALAGTVCSSGALGSVTTSCSAALRFDAVAAASNITSRTT